MPLLFTIRDSSPSTVKFDSSQIQNLLSNALCILSFHSLYDQFSVQLESTVKLPSKKLFWDSMYGTVQLSRNDRKTGGWSRARLRLCGPSTVIYFTFSVTYTITQILWFLRKILNIFLTAQRPRAATQQHRTTMIHHTFKIKQLAKSRISNVS